MGLRDFVMTELTNGIIDIVHEVFLAFVKPYTAKDLLRFFRDDTDPWLQGLLEPTMRASGALDLAVNIFRKYPSECIKRITVDEMLKQLEQHRTDLLPVIRTRQGIAWLTKRIDLLRAYIKGELVQRQDNSWVLKQPDGTWIVAWTPPH